MSQSQTPQNSPSCTFPQEPYFAIIGLVFQSSALPVKLPQTLMLLGSGELGKEVVIAAQRLGNTVIAVDRYENAPAMQVADIAEVVSMQDGDALERLVKHHQPDYVIPEIEAIRTSKLLDLERQGFRIIPTAAATNYTMNRDRIGNWPIRS